MSQSDESEKPFTVSDRRHFTPEGRPRDAEEAGASDTADEESAETLRAAAQGETPEAEPQTGAGPRRAAGGPADFSGFVMGLAAQAGTLLSGHGLPEGVDAGEALEGARSVIAILEMLKEKTAGNLSEPEAALLDELLFQLRMAYLEKTRTGGA
jgi:Domain of unknown function (DUF1844)